MAWASWRQCERIALPNAFMLERWRRGREGGGGRDVRGWEKSGRNEGIVRWKTALRTRIKYKREITLGFFFFFFCFSCENSNWFSRCFVHIVYYVCISYWHNGSCKLACCTWVASKWMYISNQIRSMAWKSFCLSDGIDETMDAHLRTSRKMPLRIGWHTACVYLVHTAYLPMPFRWVICYQIDILDRQVALHCTYEFSIASGLKHLIESFRNTQLILAAPRASDRIHTPNGEIAFYFGKCFHRSKMAWTWVYQFAFNSICEHQLKLISFASNG